ncbi:uncharacterized protein LTHEOB_9359 [Lasiodiplodia theobromae]|uniref:Uncharacterized protein n=1 Tax=Lasiodiplodia theobromae TaxID=45133 RepID=A0A5N5DCS0_9PEZI|nr:uncharacterized protein LTHEOB_9359 [Lasiodiplodia theobromae]KAB2574874.1 hypothetical protein DBV05_g6438 [Lasiodiplodia theobromae]KAF4540263.1 hypothetical protein LTHEOB_9359 [Lasiodiplodia theobromae]
MPLNPAKTNLTPTQISKVHFLAALRRYPALVPAALKPLDQIRYHDIPTAISSSPSLSAPQLEQLVEWKLKHGTFRPTLLALVRSNAPSAVEAATTEAFGILSSSRGASGGEDGQNARMEALDVLTKALKGVGPATASLVLACREPRSTPFFSDEMYRWMCWGEAKGAKGQGEGWARRIQYTRGKYKMLLEKATEVVERVRAWGLGEELGEMGEAVAVEKVAWVLQREGVDCDQGFGEEEDIFGAQVKGKGRKREAEAEEEAGMVKKAKKGQTTALDTANKSRKGKVQKSETEDSPRRQTRSSARRKT